MNTVKLLGHFCMVSAHTDGTIDIDDRCRWKQREGFYSATFLASDGAWIEVRVKTAYFEYFLSHYVENRETVQLEGRLCTEVSLGSGTVRNYIAVG